MVSLSPIATFFLQFSLLTTVFVLLHTKYAARLVNSKYKTLALLAVFALQLTTSALQFKEVGDVMLFSGAGWHLRNKIDFYFIDGNHDQYPFFPFLIFTHALANWLVERTHLFTFSFYLKILLLVAAGSIAALIKKKTSFLRALQFLTNPLTTLVIFFHGQVDVVLLAFFVWSVYVFLARPASIQKFFAGAALYTASIAAKTWSVIFLPFILMVQKTWIRRFFLLVLIFTGLIGDAFVYTRLVDGSSVRSVLPAVLRAGGAAGEWGLSLFVSPWKTVLQQNNVVVFAILLILMLTALFLYQRTRNWWDHCLMLVLAVYLIIPNWGVQYLFWVVPFWYLAPSATRAQRLWYTVGAGGYALMRYVQIASQMGAQEAPVPEGAVRFVGVAVYAVIAVLLLQIWRKNPSYV